MLKDIARCNEERSYGEGQSDFAVTKSQVEQFVMDMIAIRMEK